MLRKRGHHISMAVNGREALELVQREQFDVVVMDVQMPEMDGVEATRRIRADGRFNELPIIALTAHALGEERERCLAGGMSAFLSKPFKAHELFAAVEGWHDRASAEAPASASYAPVSRSPVTREAIVVARRLSGAHAAVVAANRNPVHPPVDLVAFREAMREAGVESIVNPTIAIYLREAPPRMARVLASLESGDGKELASAAHALKGSSGSLYAAKLSALFAELEAAGSAGNLEGARALRESVELEWARAVAYLQATLTEKAA